MTTKQNTAVGLTQVQKLRREARAAGDVVQAVLCNKALGDDDGATIDDYSGGGHSKHEMDGIARALAMTQQEAWIECARVIREAQA